MTPESLKEKSPESIKKILCILENLKAEWDLTPKKDATQSHGVWLREAYETSIPERRYWGWVEKCGVGDFFQLQNILEILEQEGLLVSTDFFNEAM